MAGDVQNNFLLSRIIGIDFNTFLKKTGFSSGAVRRPDFSLCARGDYFWTQKHSGAASAGANSFDAQTICAGIRENKCMRECSIIAYAAKVITYFRELNLGSGETVR